MARGLGKVHPTSDLPCEEVPTDTDASNITPVGDKETESVQCVSYHGLLAFIKIVLFVTVGVPSAVLIIAAFFGAILASAESWTFKDGFFYVVGNIVGLATPLVDVSPVGMVGEMLDLYIAALSLALAGVAIGFIGSFSFVSSATDYLEGNTYTDNTDVFNEVESMKKIVEGIEKRLEGMQEQFQGMASIQEQLAEIRTLVAHR